MNTEQPFGRPPDLQLGPDRGLWFIGWYPDRELNPQYVHLPDVEKFTAVISHPRADGKGGICWSGVNLDGPVQREILKGEHIWKVESWEPLTLSPSLLCRECGDHGFVRKGKWVPA
jgi:hypothetical protein